MFLWQCLKSNSYLQNNHPSYSMKPIPTYTYPLLQKRRNPTKILAILKKTFLNNSHHLIQILNLKYSTQNCSKANRVNPIQDILLFNKVFKKVKNYKHHHRFIKIVLLGKNSKLINHCWVKRSHRLSLKQNIMIHLKNHYQLHKSQIKNISDHLHANLIKNSNKEVPHNHNLIATTNKR